jgi:hypothetical protein
MPVTPCTRSSSMTDPEASSSRSPRLEPAERDTYSNGVRKASYRDLHGNELVWPSVDRGLGELVTRW